MHRDVKPHNVMIDHQQKKVPLQPGSEKPFIGRPRASQNSGQYLGSFWRPMLFSLADLWYCYFSSLQCWFLLRISIVHKKSRQLTLTVVTCLLWSWFSGGPQDRNYSWWFLLPFLMTLRPICLSLKVYLGPSNFLFSVLIVPDWWVNESASVRLMKS